VVPLPFLKLPEELLFFASGSDGVFAFFEAERETDTPGAFGACTVATLGDAERLGCVRRTFGRASFRSTNGGLVASVTGSENHVSRSNVRILGCGISGFEQLAVVMRIISTLV
jgi:hypothetical protein